MKNRIFNLTILIMFSVIFAFPYISHLGFEANLTINEDISIYNVSTPVTSAYDWDLTGSPILIDNANPSINWASRASTYGWCSGSGTWNDPYCILSVEIDGQSTGSCITIKNSNVYFQIRDCYLYNSGYAGILLENVDNGMLVDNLVDNNDDYGIAIDDGQNNSISGNTARNSYWAGIWLGWFSSYNIVSKNLVEDNLQAGILIELSDNNNITGNTVFDNGRGIHLSTSDYITVLGNNVRYNTLDGIRVYNSNHNTIFENIAAHNSYGIRLWLTSDYNTISGNTLIADFFDAYEVQEASYNNWYYQGIGNYYSNYLGKDSNDDGIGDSPHIIPGSGSVQDIYPVWWDPPGFTVNVPASNEEFGFSPPEYSITIDEGVPVYMWYIIGTERFDFTNLQGTIDAATWDKLPEGEVIIEFFIQDSESMIRSVSLTIVKNELIVYVSIFTIVGISSVAILVLAFLIRRKLKKRN